MTNKQKSDDKILGTFRSQAAKSETTGVKKDDVFKVPVHKLEEQDGFNERDYDDPEVIQKIKDFAFAYKSGHFVPPLVVRIDSATGRFYVVEGHQRRRGALLAIEEGAAIETLVCIPFRGNDMDRIHCQLSSQDGLKLKPVGIARNYLKLINMGSTEKDIATHCRKPIAHVKGMLVLAAAPTAVQKMVNQGTVSATLAIDMLRKHGDKAEEHLKGELASAQAKGKKKLKPAAVREWIPPRKNSIAIYSSLGNLAENVKKQPNVAELLEKVAQTPDVVQGTSVQVDAAALIQLLKAFDDAEALKARRAASKAEAEAGDGDADADSESRTQEEQGVAA